MFLKFFLWISHPQLHPLSFTSYRCRRQRVALTLPFAWAATPDRSCSLVCMQAWCRLMAVAACENTFDWETQQLLISPQNDCHLQLLTKCIHQPRQMAQGTCPALKLHRKCSICMGLKHKDLGLTTNFRPLIMCWGINFGSVNVQQP